MHVILGGAHNGKRAFVKQQISNFEQGKVHYYDGELPNVKPACDNEIYIISGFEKMIRPNIEQPEELVAQRIFERIFELAQTNQVYCICTDMSRGVVPLEKEARQLRDTCGRLYQKLCANATTVTRIWYGISQQLKGENHG